MEQQEGDITRMLAQAGSGDAVAAAAVYDRVYRELRAIARAHRRRWERDATLDTTALIHEAYLRLAGRRDAVYENRTHFYATASRAMRQVLANYAERRLAAKRAGERAAVDVDDLPLPDGTDLDELLSVHALLTRLEAENPRGCRIVECRVFGGMSIEETAAALGISPATTKRDWSVLSAWLYRELGEAGA